MFNFVKFIKKQELKNSVSYYRLCSTRSCAPNRTSGIRRKLEESDFYTELYKRCPTNQLKHLKLLHAKHKEYKAKIESLPATLPPIEWDSYKFKVDPERVKIIEEFEEKYKNFQIPEPEIPQEIENQLQEEEKQTKEMIEKFVKQSNEKIKEYECRIECIKSMLPYNQMTMEEYMEARPECAPDFLNKPTFWPHTKDENEEKKPVSHHH